MIVMVMRQGILRQDISLKEISKYVKLGREEDTMRLFFTVLFIALTLGVISTFVELMKDMHENPEEAYDDTNYIRRL